MVAIRSAIVVARNETGVQCRETVSKKERLQGDQQSRRPHRGRCLFFYSGHVLGSVLKVLKGGVDL